VAGAETVLWPFLGFLTVAALVSWWQAHVARRELEAGKSRRGNDWKERQEEIAGFRRSRQRRAVVFAGFGLLAIVYLTMVG
jgi:hypothetical protein